MRLVCEHRDEHPSAWAGITLIAKKLRMTPATLRTRLRRDAVDVHARSVRIAPGWSRRRGDPDGRAFDAARQHERTAQDG